MKAVLCLSALLLGAVSVPADTLQLRDGRVINGTYEGGDRSGVRFRPYNEDRGRFFDLDRVATISFDNGNNSASGAWNNGGQYNNDSYNNGSYYGSADRARSQGYRDQYGDQTANMAPATAAPAPAPMPQSTYNGGYNNGGRYNNSGAYSSSNIQSDGPYIPAGTVITVRTLDPIDSDANQIGNNYQVTLAQPIVVNGNMVAPAGATATVQVMAVQGGNRISGRGDISLQLVSFTGSNGQVYNVASSDAVVTGGSRGRQSAEVIGGGAALGAIIGGIAGGGGGAAIGAAAGAATGAGVQLMRGHHIRIQPETLLSFTLQQNVTL